MDFKAIDKLVVDCIKQAEKVEFAQRSYLHQSQGWREDFDRQTKAALDAMHAAQADQLRIAKLPDVTRTEAFATAMAAIWQGCVDDGDFTEDGGLNGMSPLEVANECLHFHCHDHLKAFVSGNTADYSLYNEALTYIMAQYLYPQMVAAGVWPAGDGIGE